MSQEEARKLLDAWAFFDKHPEAKNWEGMPRAEFYRLVQIIAGTDSLVDAKEYFEGVAAGEITGDMPTALLEAQKEGQNVSARLSTSKDASRATKSWLAKLNVKDAEGVAEKQVAAAQVQAVVERVEEATPTPKVAAEIKTPEAPSPTPEAPTSVPTAEKVTPTPAPAEEGIGIKISSGALESFQQLAGKATATPLAVISLFSPPKSAVSPQTSAAVSSALSLSQIAQRAEKLPEPDKKRILTLVDNLRKTEFSFVQQTQFAQRFLSIREITILGGPEFGMDQGSIIALLGGGRGIPEKGPSLFARVGQQLFGSLAQTAANKAISGALTKAGISVAGKAAATATAKGLGATIGTAIGGPIGTALGAAAGWISSKIIDKLIDFVREHRNWAVASLFAPVVVAGIVFGIPLLTVGGVAGIGISLLGGPSAAISSVGGFLGTAASAFGSIVLGSIAAPIIIALISIPALVVIILFIINSGAYITPPPASLIAGLLVSPYIDVKKEANPKGPFQNSDLSPNPITIEYTITIKAKKGTLTNVRITDKCDVTKKGSAPSCPAASPALPASVQEISQAGEGFVFKYKRVFTSPTFEDTYTVDAIEVTADAPEKKNAQAAASARIKIGEPPEECPSGWPVGGILTQGAYTSSTHKGTEAIDIAGNRGKTVVARNSGIVRAKNLGPFGKHVEIVSSCAGKEFFSRYAHLAVVSVQNGQHVSLGDKVGTVGNTGNVFGKNGGYHLHYEFRYEPSAPTRYPDSPPYMMKDYIDKNLPRGCIEAGPCGNTYIP